MNESLLLWCDLETTGTDPDLDQILEIACVVTREDLEPLRSFQAVIHPAEPLTMCSLVAAMHGKNGLLVECHESTNTTLGVEAYVMNELREAGAAGDLSIAGATIHFDKSFLRVHMPTLHARLHYRTFDVSTLKAAASMWIAKMPKSLNERHRAMGDVESALELARKFRSAFAGAPADFRSRLDLPSTPSSLSSKTPEETC